MVRLALVLVLGGMAASEAAADPLSAEQYHARFPPQAGDHGDQAVLQRCLSAWGEHPFGASEEIHARFIDSSVRVMGFGREKRDDAVSRDPQLILLRPSVSVMSKTTYELLNPKGWYCFDASVIVMGKAVIRIDCDAYLADARSGLAIAGRRDGSGAVAVMGSVRIERVGSCPAASTEPTDTEPPKVRIQ